MRTIKEYKIDFTSVDLTKQVEEFFEYYDKRDIFIHSLNVANEAKSLATKFNVSEEKAYTAGLLHDISIVIPNEDRVLLQKQMGEELLKEEEMLPMILHQKQSVFISEVLFNIKDSEILSAIECHTTLRKNASIMDKIIFIADKIKWDGKDSAPYLNELDIALNNSLDEACRVYSRWSLSDIVVLHPWFKEAMEDLDCN